MGIDLNDNLIVITKAVEYANISKIRRALRLIGRVQSGDFKLEGKDKGSDSLKEIHQFIELRSINRRILVGELS